VLVRKIFCDRLLLHVVGQDDDAGRARGQGGAKRPVEHHRRLLRSEHGLHVLRGDVLEEALQVDLLLVLGAEDTRLLLTDYGHHRHVVELGVVETVEQVHRSGALGARDDAHPAGVLGLATAIRAAFSSCRAWTGCGSPPARRSAPMNPLMPSPG